MSSSDCSYSSGEEEDNVYNDVINPFTEEGYAKVAGLQGGDGTVPPRDTVSGHSILNPHRLNTNATFTFKQRIEKNISDRSLDTELLNSIASKRDLLYLKQSPDHFHDTQLTTLAAFCLNHSLSVRDGIMKNNMKLAKDATAEVRDQGFTRPRILFVCPFKNTAHKFVTAMMELWEGGNAAGEGQVEQKRRFQEEYGRVVDSDGEEVEEDLSGRPRDYQHVFAGNIDDCFRIGIKMTRKALKLYADFYSADILVVSPLGLKLVMDGQDQPVSKPRTKYNNNKKGNDQDKKRKMADSDYLSSIECFIVDQCDVIAMQNWEHLSEIFEKLNALPKDSHGCDFSRVLNVFLDKQAVKFRQSVFLSAFGFPELTNLFGKYCKNVFGVEVFERINYDAVLSLSKLKPEFHLLPLVTDPLEEAELRFTHFKDDLLKQLTNQNHILLIVSNYFEFLRVKDLLEEQQILHSAISEYSDQKEVTRARSRFFNGHSRLLLLTERFHFFHRFSVKSVKRVVFYSLPAYAQFVSEFVEMVWVREGVKVAPIVMVSQLDCGKVERIFGTKNLHKIYHQ